MKKSKIPNIQTILDRIDDDLDYFYALFDVMASANEKSSDFVSIEVLSRDASSRVVNLKNFIQEEFQRKEKVS